MKTKTIQEEVRKNMEGWTGKDEVTNWNTIIEMRIKQATLSQRQDDVKEYEK
jgi:hypothetical protein